MQYMAVLFGITEDEETHFEHLTAAGSPADVLGEVRKKLLIKGFGFHPEFQEDIADDMVEIIDNLPSTTKNTG